MAKFTAAVPLKIKLPAFFEIDGAAGATHRIPDALVEEFLRDQVPLIPGGVAWITQDETTGAATLPVAQSDVTNLTSDLAGKYDKAGGIISGAVTATGALVAQASVSTPSMTATAARFKGDPWFDVKGYGAVGDDSADDTAAIQAAIDAASTGGTIFFPKGTYKITSPLSVAVPLMFRGTLGRELPTSVVHQVTASAIGISFASTANPSVIADMGIVGSATSANTAAYGIDAAKDVHLERVQIKSFYDGMRVGAGSFYATIAGSHFLSNAHAGIALVSGMTNMTIFGGTRFAYSQYGIYGTGSIRGLRMMGGAIEEMSQYGVFIDGANASQIALGGIWFETTSAFASPGLGYVKLGSTAAVKAVSIRDCFFFPTDITSFWDIDASNTTNLSVAGSFFGSTGAGGGSYRFASTVSDVDMGANHYQTAINIANNSAAAFRQSTDGAHITQGATTAQAAFAARVAGDIANRFNMGADGLMAWGTGAAVRDTYLGRSTTKTLTLDDGSAGPVTLVINGNRVATPGAVQQLTAASAILANSEFVMVQASATATLTSAPTIASGTDGQIIKILNVGSFNIVLQDQGTLASSNLRLTATGVTLGPRDSIQLIYSNTVGDWVQIGSLVNVL